MKAKTIWRGWALGSLATFAVLETKAISDKVPGTTLSHVWWQMRTKPGVRLLIFPPAAWLVHHFFNPLDEKTGGWDDVAVVAAGAGLALIARYEDRSGL